MPRIAQQSLKSTQNTLFANRVEAISAEKPQN
jgi:hypothetical protein